MSRVKVLTYCTNSSYGSILQSLGLKKALAELGYDSTIIMSSAKPSEKYMDTLAKNRSPKSILLYLLKRLVIKKREKRYINTNKFINDHLDIEYYGTYENLCMNNSEEGIFIAGSDQIWNPKKLIPEFFLDFANKKALKMSYAASMGVLESGQLEKEIFANLIKNFDRISVREEDNVPFIKEITDKTVSVNIDPTFLWESEEWRRLSSKYPVDKKYILVYPLYWDKKYNAQLKRLRQETDYDIVVIADNYRNIYADIWVFDADPAQFLWLIDHAEAVVSSSFHGIAMSIILNKKVASVINPASPSRIKSLLKVLEYPILKIEELSMSKDIDWDMLNTNIANESEKGKSYLREALIEHKK